MGACPPPVHHACRTDAPASQTTTGQKNLCRSLLLFCMVLSLGRELGELRTDGVWDGWHLRSSSAVLRCQHTKSSSSTYTFSRTRDMSDPPRSRSQSLYFCLRARMYDTRHVCIHKTRPMSLDQSECDIYWCVYVMMRECHYVRGGGYAWLFPAVVSCR